MAAAGTRTLEFTVLSAEDSASRGDPADSDGGSYPQWNEKVVVEMPMPPANSVTLEVRSGNRVVGPAFQVFVIISFFHFL
ncbi:unnamed protein product [Linum trigynum]|uniref:C2 domain-containing protein n=1 Tax=Linum trigynum TaxID=586398 RepID=A0AAV2D7P3_9ROSI